MFHGYYGMLAADAKLQVAPAATAADKTEAEKKIDMTSPQHEIQAASSLPPGKATNELEMENNILDTKCTIIFLHSTNFSH